MHIQIGHIFKQSFQNVWEHKLEWVRLAFAPLVIWALGILFMTLIFWKIGYPLAFHEAVLGQIPSITMDQPPSISILLFGGLAKLIHEVFYWVALLSLMINGFRYGTLHEGGKHWWTLRLNKRFWKMLLYMFLIIILVSVYAIIGTLVVLGAQYFFENVFLDIALGALFILYGLYVFLRISLYGFLIAIDKTHPLRTSWHLVKGNIWRLIGLTLLIAITIGVLFAGIALVFSLLGLLLALISPLLMESLSVLVVLFSGVFSYLVFWAVFSKAYALVYQTLKKGKDA